MVLTFLQLLGDGLGHELVHLGGRPQHLLDGHPRCVHLACVQNKLKTV